MNNSSINYQEEKEGKKNDVPQTLTMKQNLIILKQQTKSICKITTSGSHATGFLCCIPNPVLITNNHVLNEE